ncbi:MAG: hypothetical protein A3H96_19300 [Acidobacteria bacterium RIFCSPLOWO2_02_FULL_67_36]|nr:MAG: hypothetical protein A3H96_19300 [Acidobacteria bacterium RIFCSPLOWO2_02_FULL_67_36]OFW25267.1 MAG: hypothetical protein A3G21_19825 [Acidobacteria bacterium RIFCSPLOWO2_12_FULL_66_21]
MKRTGVALLIGAGVLLLVVGAAGTAFYVKVYRPLGSPLMAMAGGKTLEERRLQNRAEFLAPASGELTAEQTAKFAVVEEEVQKQLAAGIAVLARSQADLERARETHALSVQTALLAFGDIKGVYLNAKVAQIDAMNRANFSKEEFEWVRKQLYYAAGLRLSQVDVSEVLAGVPDATVVVRRFEARERVPEQNQRLALPLASKLQTWAALGFFGL